MSLKLIALCSSFNRRDKTVSAVTQLLSECDLVNIEFKVIVVDNNSVDGTFEALDGSSSRVSVLLTPCNMYWAESMRYGFSNLRADNYDAVMVFNDDIQFYPGSLAKALSDFLNLQRNNIGPFAYVLTFVSSIDNNSVTYGGFSLSSFFPTRLVRVLPGLTHKLIDSCNMNCVLISKECIQKFGFLQPPFRHSLSDLDYGLRVSRNGGTLLLAAGTYGVCDRNSTDNTWRDTSKSFVDRFRLMQSPKGRPLNERSVYLRRHFGLLGLLFIITPFLLIN